MGRVDLGLRDEEFWRLTLRQFDALLRRQNQIRALADFRAGTITAVLANVNRDPKKGRAYTPADFFPSLRAHQPPEPAPIEVWKKIVSVFRAFRGMPALPETTDRVPQETRR